jgi:hypothetical protein
MPITTFTIAGYATIGDLGAGATYTSEGASSSSIGATQDASGTWFRLVPADKIMAAWYGALPDGNDHTTALQQAINDAIAVGRPLELPSGKINISAPLTFGTEPANPSAEGKIGWKMYGAGPGVAEHGCGTTLLLSGAAHDSVLKVFDGIYEYLDLQDFTLQVAQGSRSETGLLFLGTRMGAHTVNRVVVRATTLGGIGYAFAIKTHGTDQNGEFINFNDCEGAYVDNFFYTNAGEAYVQHFHHCRGLINVGGVFFTFDNTSGGMGATIFDFNGTALWDANNISNSIFIKGNDLSSSLVVIGGRIEHITTLYYQMGNSMSVGGTPTIIGMNVTCDFDPTNVHLTQPAAIVATGTQDNLVLQSNSILGTNNNCTFPISHGNWSCIKLLHNNFDQFARPPYLVTGQVGSSNVIAEGNRCNTIGTSHDLNAFDLSADIGPIISVGQRKTWGESSLNQVGIPDNYLVTPQVTIATGVGLTPPAPWHAAGSTLTITAGDWMEGTAPLSVSPWAKHIVISPTSWIYQDVKAFDLSIGNFNSYGSPCTLVTYQAFVTKISGTHSKGFGRIRIVNSVNHTVYAERVFNGAGILDPQVITLTAVIHLTEVAAYRNRACSGCHNRA